MQALNSGIRTKAGTFALAKSLSIVTEIKNPDNENIAGTIG